MTAPHYSSVQDVANVDSGPAFRSSRFGEVGEGIPLLRGENIEPGALRWSKTRTWPESFLSGYEHLLVQEGDLILGMDRPVVAAGLKLAMVRPGDVPALLVQRVARIRPQSIDGRYLYLWLSSNEFIQHLQRSATGTQLPHVNLASIREFRIPRFGEDAERRIVDRLEDHLSRLDAADRAVTDSIKRLDRLRDSALAKAVGDARSDPTTRVLRLGELARVSTGTTPLRSNKAFYEDGTTPWITSGDLHKGLISGASQFVTQFALAETSLKLIPAGSLLIAMYGEGRTRGTAAELGIDATTNQACASVELNEPGLRAWVRLVLDANYNSMRRMAAGGVQPNLNLSLVRSIEVPVPIPAVRNTAIAHVRDVSDAREQLAIALASATKRGAHLRRSLLTAAFSGRLTGATTHVARTDMIEALAGV